MKEAYFLINDLERLLQFANSPMIQMHWMNGNDYCPHLNEVATSKFQELLAILVAGLDRSRKGKWLKRRKTGIQRQIEGILASKPNVAIKGGRMYFESKVIGCPENNALLFAKLLRNRTFDYLGAWPEVAQVA